MLESKAFEIGVTLIVKEKGKKKKVVVSMKNSPEKGQEFVPASYTGEKGSYTFQLLRMNPDREDKARSSVEISLSLPETHAEEQAVETLVVEASVKPMINLVWIGTITLIVGFFLTIIRRVEEARDTGGRWHNE
jgi:hypothetical protein